MKLLKLLKKDENQIIITYIIFLIPISITSFNKGGIFLLWINNVLLALSFGYDMYKNEIRKDIYYKGYLKY